MVMDRFGDQIAHPCIREPGLRIDKLGIIQIFHHLVQICLRLLQSLLGRIHFRLGGSDLLSLAEIP